MNRLFPPSTSLKTNLQTRLLVVAAVILLLFAAILTLSPAVRLHSWQVEYRWQHWIGYVVWLVGFFLLSSRMHRLLPEADPYLFPVAALLSGWGVLTIWRLDSTLGLRQTLWLAVSLLTFWVVVRLPHMMGTLRRYKYLWLTGSLGLTALTFLVGTYPGGGEPRLWLDFGGIYLQPSEPLKLMLIAFLAAYLADNLPVNLGLLQLLLPSLVISGAALGILIAQRDLGTASLFMLLYAAMVFHATGKRRILLLSAVLILAAGFFGYRFFDVIQVRVDAWLNPWLDPSGRSYQIVQSLLAVATGGAGGTGIGMGNPGIVRVGFMYGRLQRAVEEDTSAGRFTLPAYQRTGYAGRLGIGNSADYIDLVFLKAKDDPTSLQRAPRNSLVLPGENLVFGLNGTTEVIGGLRLSLDAAGSNYTRDVRAQTITSSEYGLSAFDGAQQTRASTQFYTAVKAGFAWSLPRLRLARSSAACPPSRRARRPFRFPFATARPRSRRTPVPRSSTRRSSARRSRPAASPAAGRCGNSARSRSAASRPSLAP